MQDLRLILIVIGAFAILALLVHGLLVSRKERSVLFCDRAITKQSKTNPKTENLVQNSAEGVGEVRVLYRKNSENVEPMLGKIEAEHGEESASSPLSFDDELASAELSVPVQDDLFARQQTKPSAAMASEPVVRTEKNPSLTENGELVLVLHVVAHPGTQIRGDVLLQSILQAGFQFGSMSIFHRHLHPTGTGPVLFSLANMVKPGFFDLNNMANFSTSGVSLFIMIPTACGDSSQNFKLMLQSAQRIADDVGAVVKDEEHLLLTPQKLADYQARIKKVLSTDFESVGSL